MYFLVALRCLDALECVGPVSDSVSIRPRPPPPNPRCRGVRDYNGGRHYEGGEHVPVMLGCRDAATAQGRARKIDCPKCSSYYHIASSVS